MRSGRHNNGTIEGIIKPAAQHLISVPCEKSKLSTDVQNVKVTLSLVDWTMQGETTCSLRLHSLQTEQVRADVHLPVHACCHAWNVATQTHTYTHSITRAPHCRHMRAQANMCSLCTRGCCAARLAVPTGKADVFTFKQYQAGQSPGCCCGPAVWRRDFKNRLQKATWHYVWLCFTDKLIIK